MRYQHRILQTGSLPLRHDGRITSVEHRCTAALVWPVGADPNPDNALLTDPCFTVAGFSQARAVLSELGVDLSSLRYVFQTHGHYDHQLCVPPGAPRPSVAWCLDVTKELPGLGVVPCPGHSEDSRALVFADVSGRRVYVAGDAVLDRDWLLAWGYYWPNCYGPEEVVRHWHSVAEVLQADVIVPGHGEPIEVTAALCEELARLFDLAEYSYGCAEVRDRILERAGR